MPDRKIYIIILNWNGYADTKLCLDSLFNIVDADFQVLVVDNGSQNKDEIKRLRLQYPALTVIENERNEGFCRGNNIAIEYCLARQDCDYIMLLNNDTVVEKDFLSPLLEFLKEKPKSVVAPMVLNYPDNGRVQTVGGKFIGGMIFRKGRGKKRNYYKQPLSPDYICGTCFMASCKAFREIGLLDEQFFAYYEDADWSWRAKARGYALITLPASIIFHKHSQSTKGSFLKAYLIARNSVFFIRKNFHGFRAFVLMVVSISITFGYNVLKYHRLKAFWKFIQGVKDGFRSKVNKV